MASRDATQATRQAAPLQKLQDGNHNQADDANADGEIADGLVDGVPHCGDEGV